MRHFEFSEGRTDHKGYFKDGKHYDSKEAYEAAMAGEQLDEENIPDLEIGDEIKTGKFRNVKAEIKDFKTDDNGQPVVKTNKGDKKAYSFRVSKLEKKDK